MDRGDIWTESFCVSPFCLFGRFEISLDRTLQIERGVVFFFVEWLVFTVLMTLYFYEFHVVFNNHAEDHLMGELDQLDDDGSFIDHLVVPRLGSICGSVCFGFIQLN